MKSWRLESADGIATGGATGDYAERKRQRATSESIRLAVQAVEEIRERQLQSSILPVNAPLWNESWDGFAHILGGNLNDGASTA